MSQPKSIFTKNRLLYPQKRDSIDTPFCISNYDEVLEYISSKIKETSSDRVGILSILDRIVTLEGFTYCGQLRFRLKRGVLIWGKLSLQRWLDLPKTFLRETICLFGSLGWPWLGWGG